MKIQFVQEKRGEVERIQKEFRGKLSDKAILQATSTAINGVLRRAKSRLKRRVMEEYTISGMYWDRTVQVKPWSSPSTLYGGISINNARLPLIAFNPKQNGSAISVAIHKGKVKHIRNSFIATVPATSKSGAVVNTHTGVFSRGHYQGKSFIYARERTGSGKIRITQRMGPSTFTMATRQAVADDVHQYMGNEIAARVHGILTSRVNKIALTNK